MTFVAELATILETSEKNALIRASKLHIMPKCDRCAGCGSYSFNQIHGDMCYACNGSGARAVKTAAEELEVLEAAKETKINGKFAEYIVYLDALKLTKNATDQCMKAWKASGVSAEYDWRNSAEFARTGAKEFRRDAEISEINFKMSQAYDAVSKLHPNPKSPTYQADVIKLAEIMKTSLVTIEAARLELVEYLEKNPR
jgi:hypothetical protein